MSKEKTTEKKENTIKSRTKAKLMSILKKNKSEEPIGDVEQWEKANPLDIALVRRLNLEMDDKALKRLSEDSEALHSLLVASYCAKKAEEEGNTQLSARIKSLLDNNEVKPEDIGMYSEKVLSGDIDKFESSLKRMRDNILKEEKIKVKKEIKKGKIMRRLKGWTIGISLLTVIGLAIGSYFFTDYKHASDKEVEVAKVTDKYDQKLNNLEAMLPPITEDKLRESTNMPVRQKLDIKPYVFNEKFIDTKYIKLKNSAVAEKELKVILAMHEQDYGTNSKKQRSIVKKKINALEKLVRKHSLTKEAFKADQKINDLYYFNMQFFPKVNMEKRFSSFLKKYGNSVKDTTLPINFIERMFRLNLKKHNLEEAAGKTLKWMENVAKKHKGTLLSANIYLILGQLYEGSDFTHATKEPTLAIDPRLTGKYKNAPDLVAAITAYQNTIHDEQSASVAVAKVGLLYAKAAEGSIEGSLLADGLPVDTYITAIEYLKGATKMAKDPILLQQIHFRLGTIYQELGDLLSASESYGQAAGMKGGEDSLEKEAIQSKNSIDSTINAQMEERKKAIRDMFYN